MGVIENGLNQHCGIDAALARQGVEEHFGPDNLIWENGVAEVETKYSLSIGRWGINVKERRESRRKVGYWLFHPKMEKVATIAQSVFDLECRIERIGCPSRIANRVAKRIWANHA